VLLVAVNQPADKEYRMNANPKQSDVLILAVDQTLTRIADHLIRIVGETSPKTHWPLFVVESAGEAMLRIHQHQPRAAVVCAGQSHLDETSVLIDTLRIRRPELSLLAITDSHNQTIERAVRIAGATYYFPLDSSSDEKLLRETLSSAGLIPTVTIGKAVRSLKRSRASPPQQRSRGHPRRTFLL
jgi:hypothetical protein